MKLVTFSLENVKKVNHKNWLPVLMVLDIAIIALFFPLNILRAFLHIISCKHAVIVIEIRAFSSSFLKRPLAKIGKKRST